MSLPISAAALTTSVVGTATPVIYAAAVVLASHDIGLADTGSLGVVDQETVGGPGVASVGLSPSGASGDSLLGFLHANLDPHVQPVVALVGQTSHG